MHSTLKELGMTLKAARNGRGLSQRALAKIAGIDQARIPKIEAGNIDLRISSLVDIARTLGLELVLTESAIEVDPGRQTLVIAQIVGDLQRLMSDIPEDRQLKQAATALFALSEARLTGTEISKLEDASALLKNARPETEDALRAGLRSVICIHNEKVRGETS